jgi:alpha,alpha-trehalase
MLGLARQGRQDLVESMLTDFGSLIDRYGHIPNGTRTYYLSRSQPPFFALMLDLSTETATTVRSRRLVQLRKEYDWWMAGADGLKPGHSSARVVRMADGALLNRYWDAKDVPRDESWREDVATAREANRRPAGEVYRDLRAAAESGWDFSSRWLGDGRTLTTIRTTRIVPVDLNALLYAVESRIADGCAAVADDACTVRFRKAAADRKEAVSRWLWVKGEGRFADFVLDANAITPTLSAATLYPLFTGLADAAQADAVADMVKARLVAPGGLRTTNSTTGQQWDGPNGWAPLQWIAVSGLERYGHSDLARGIAGAFLCTVERTYAETGKLLEKYDVEERRPGGGGEYPLQDGFGWTNGVVVALAEKHRPSCP